MPELPEVETIAKDLAGVLKGQRVIDAVYRNEFIREAGNSLPGSILIGRNLDEIERRGKNLIFRFSGGISMVCHLKMTGRLLLECLPYDQDKHLHFYMKFERTNLYFYDVRKFGRIGIFNNDQLLIHPRLSKLGPEPFAVKPREFASSAQKRKKAIKLVLMDQEFIAGVGNIYADESLFDAGIRPSAKSSRISMTRLLKLHASIKKVLKSAIKNRGSSVDDYLDGFGQSGRFQRLIKVYGRTNESCLKCGATIKRIVLGGRSTHYCPRCQR